MEDTSHKVEYRIRDLATRSVTLFPSRAQVVREIKDVPLKVSHPPWCPSTATLPTPMLSPTDPSQPGANEITIVGLTPTVDEHSIKVEGSGSYATITDISIVSLPNPDIFQDIYPDSDDDDY